MLHSVNIILTQSEDKLLYKIYRLLYPTIENSESEDIVQLQTLGLVKKTHSGYSTTSFGEAVISSNHQYFKTLN